MFEKYPGNPVIPRTPGTFYSLYAANPDVLEFNGELLYYFRGQGDDCHDQLGLAVTTKEDFNGVTWKRIYPEPVLPVNPDASAPDGEHILDPGSIVYNGKVYLYYTAYAKNGDVSICLAVSEDGIHFERSRCNPVIPDALAPEPIEKDGRFYLFYQRWQKNETDVPRMYFCESEDGEHFDTANEVPVLAPAEGAVSIVTNRFVKEGEWVYDLLGKPRRYRDYPESIGIARSKDLIHWTYSSRDVLTRGEPGTWDEGAVWFPTVYRHNGKYYLWYEGGGTGNGRKTPEDIAASDLAINGEYGGYGVTTFSQIGLAVYDGNLSDFFD